MVGGCLSASLASNSGPPRFGTIWSDASRQEVVVGETVRFDFVLQDARRRFVPPVGLADYCVAHVDGERIETDMDEFGRFRFTHTFDRLKPGDQVSVRAGAYRQHGARDFMMVNGRWVQRESPFDLPDRRVAQDAIDFTVYEAPIELTLARPRDELQPKSGLLTILRRDGSTTKVYTDRPHRRGFTLAQPSGEGYCLVRYNPTGEELNPTGTTDVEFVIYDTAGGEHRTSTTLKTP